MTPLEMIAEWRKGCSCGGPPFDLGMGNAEGTTSPAQCEECTVALIDALESVLREPNPAMEDAGMAEADKSSFGVAVVPIWRAMAGVEQ